MKKYSLKMQYLQDSLDNLKMENLSLLVNYPKKIFHKVMILELKDLMLFQIKNMMILKYKIMHKVLFFTQTLWVFKFFNLRKFND